ncbi:hypothetical protein L1987_45006 [Smallanthus sonchifolius]|uniref:Uncharacterized protein n=1 Tax=Smallanthus sonchifolius TaxID=185202 RepID=A0ACB9GQX0_9ASTR|nr:hypothetical protein L1987_45006 [Smallanthus sonchifolius]
MALSPSGSSKRASSNAVTCLVNGCASDLSDCRKYYQRHKSAGQQVHPHPTVDVMNPPWSEVVQAPLWLDHSNYAPSLLSSPVASLSHVVNPQSGSGSVSITASSLDQELISYGGMENDFDVGWGGVTDMETYHHASYDHER